MTPITARTAGLVAGAAFVAGGAASLVNGHRLRGAVAADRSVSAQLACDDRASEVIANVGGGILLATGAALLAPRSAIAAASRGLAHLGPASGRAERAAGLARGFETSLPAVGVVGFAAGIPAASVAALAHPTAESVRTAGPGA